MSHIDKLTLPSAVFVPLNHALKWIANRPPIVQIVDEQHSWFTKFFMEAMTFSPEYVEVESPSYSLEYDGVQNLIELVLVDHSLTVTKRIPVVEDSSLPSPTFEDDEDKSNARSH